PNASRVRVPVPRFSTVALTSRFDASAEASMVRPEPVTGRSGGAAGRNAATIPGRDPYSLRHKATEPSRALSTASVGGELRLPRAEGGAAPPATNGPRPDPGGEVPGEPGEQQRERERDETRREQRQPGSRPAALCAGLVNAGDGQYHDDQLGQANGVEPHGTA